MATETLVPSAIEALSNLTGSVGDVNNTISGSDGVFLQGVDDGTDTVVRAEFPTPTGNPTVGADLQTFRIRCRRSTTSGGNNPTLDVSLYENDSLVSSLQTGISITSTSGQIVEVSWNASLLGSADGSQVEVHLVGNRSGGSPSSRRTVEFDEIEWLVEYSVGGARRVFVT